MSNEGAGAFIDDKFLLLRKRPGTHLLNAWCTQPCGVASMQAIQSVIEVAGRSVAVVVPVVIGCVVIHAGSVILQGKAGSELPILIFICQE
ncbi:hypothetical protein D3C72_1955650 [compost metagenome]